MSSYLSILLLLLVSISVQDLLFAQSCPFDGDEVSFKDPTILSSLLQSYVVEKNTKECESQLPKNSSLFPTCENESLVPTFSTASFIHTRENM